MALLRRLVPSLAVGHQPPGDLAEEGHVSGCDVAQSAATVSGPADKAKPGERGSNRPVRTKVTTKEFSKYDINPEKIQRGEDSRTTVMVRNLTGPNARKDFLFFLGKCKLHERYTFFYMPCKEHRNVPAGFAFLNFVAPSDVHKLYVMVKSGFWREFLSDAHTKAPAMSYARFQGHEELVRHFNSSAVLHEQDPEKRPIFRSEAACLAAPDGGHQGGAGDAAEEPIVQYKDEGGTGATGSPKLVLPPASELYSAAVSSTSSELQAALERGAKEIAAILMRQTGEGEAGADARRRRGRAPTPAEPSCCGGEEGAHLEQVGQGMFHDAIGAGIGA